MMDGEKKMTFFKINYFVKIGPEERHKATTKSKTWANFNEIIDFKKSHFLRAIHHLYTTYAAYNEKVLHFYYFFWLK